MNWITLISDFLNGLVRPAVTLMFASTVCYLSIRSGVSVSAEALFGMAGTIMAFWFAARQTDKAITAMANNNAINRSIDARRPLPQLQPCGDTGTTVINNAPVVSPNGEENVQARPASPSIIVSDTSSDPRRPPVG